MTASRLHTRWRRSYSITLASLLGWMLAAGPIVFPTAISQRLDASLSDPLARQLPSPPPSPWPVFIVDIDERSLETLGPFSQWPRLYLAQVLTPIAQHATAVGVDLLILDPDQWSTLVQIQAAARGIPELPPQMLEGFDQRLADLPNNIVWASHLDLSGEVPEVKLPQPSLLDPLAPHGFANLFPDADGVIRLGREQVDGVGGIAESSLPWAVYQVAHPQAGAPPTGWSNLHLFPETIGSGDTILMPRFSFIDCLTGSIPLKAFDGAVVFLGSSAAGLSQFWPVRGGWVIPGVDLMAQRFQQIAGHDLKPPMSPAMQLLWIALVVASVALEGAAMGMLKKRRFTWVRIAEVVLLWVIVVEAMVILGGEIPPVLPTVIALLATYVLSLLGRYLFETRSLMRSLTRYIPHTEAMRLIDTSIDQLRKGERRVITIMFVDLRGFTTYSEQNTPEAVVETLNGFFDLVVPKIEGEHGVINRFAGDGILAFFGAPTPLADHADRALRAACAVLNQNPELERRYGLRCGATVHTGEVVLAHVGTSYRLEYTINGDAVNLTSRLQDALKERGLEGITTATTEAALIHPFPLRDIGMFSARGRSRDIGLLEIVCGDGGKADAPAVTST
ncbi:MAG: hypothetical protein COX57_03860 [Alphaproteobacteria bacterium CG_4_10_14_0_2_um_filter_63_37]|nr:MAG: hypothetical protein AUJ55_08350 [Proteobacteria bacterium CG1_02_64_396]PJA25342.1 MAG: hypothetical protein COX57_03860 [Alphaproteobacteria bacterium CG_4_10_14_0_2_um_filter_63_37]